MISVLFLDLVKTDGAIIHVNAAEVAAIVEVENHIKLLICGDWYDIQMTKAQYLERVNNEM